MLQANGFFSPRRRLSGWLASSTKGSATVISTISLDTRIWPALPLSPLGAVNEATTNSGPLPSFAFVSAESFSTASVSPDGIVASGCGLTPLGAKSQLKSTGSSKPGLRVSLMGIASSPPRTTGIVGGTTSMENGAGSVTAITKRSSRTVRQASPPE